MVDLNIVELSNNNFYGAIPNCFGKMPFENKHRIELLEMFSGYDVDFSDSISVVSPSVAQLSILHEKANFTSKKIIDTYKGTILAYM